MFRCTAGMKPTQIIMDSRELMSWTGGTDLFHQGIDAYAINSPTPMPRNVKPVICMSNPCFAKMIGKASKDRYNIPRIRAVLR